MSVFDSCFLMLVNPRGGVEDIAYLKGKVPWVKGVFVNVRDYPADSWATVRSPIISFSPAATEMLNQTRVTTSSGSFSTQSTHCGH